MAQFDIVELSDKSLALVLQADLLDSTNTLVVAPLVRDKALMRVPRLHPLVQVGRLEYVVLTDKLGAVLRADVKRTVLSIKDRDYDIRRSLDIVFMGV